MKQILAKIQIYIMVWLALLSSFVWGLGWLSSPVSHNPTPVYITIPSGSNAAQVAQILDSAGLIRAQRIFLLTVGLRGAAERLKPGLFKLNRSMSLLQIIHKLVAGDVTAQWFTVPEGYTVAEIASLLGERKIADENEFRLVASRQAARFADIVPVSSDSLEGYLFPDTYLLPPGSGSEAVIRQMLKNFSNKVEKPLRTGIEKLALPGDGAVGYRNNLHAVLTLASLIEREALTQNDRPLISSVLRNRLDKGMPLQIDATVQYALGEHRVRLYYRDYDTPSPYNTYLHKGLPPGPIANPGLAAIEAALRPAKSDYLYYVAAGNGSHVFTRSLGDHLNAVAASRRARRGSEVQ